MGIHDRQYFREDEQSGGFSLGGDRMLVTNIVVVTAILFLIDIFTAEHIEVGGSLRRWLALDAGLFQEHWRVWQLLTYGFMHGGIFHILINMFMLWMFGRDIELHYGRKEFLRFYLASIVVAGLVWLLIHNLTGGQAPGVVGASGAVVAVIILYALNYPQRTVYIWGLVAIPAWLMAVLYVAIDVMGAIGAPGRVAYEAHLAGAAFALAYFRFGWNLGRVLSGGISFGWLKPKPKLKVHDPGSKFRELDAQADQILEKLHRDGEESLTERERRILEDYSRRMRQKYQ